MGNVKKIKKNFYTAKGTGRSLAFFGGRVGVGLCPFFTLADIDRRSYGIFGRHADEGAASRSTSHTLLQTSSQPPISLGFRPLRHLENRPLFVLQNR